MPDIPIHDAKQEGEGHDGEQGRVDFAVARHACTGEEEDAEEEGGAIGSEDEGGEEMVKKSGSTIAAAVDEVAAVVAVVQVGVVSKQK